MFSNPLTAKATLAIDLKAQGSQQLVVLLMIGCLIFLGIAMIFLFLEVSLWFVPLLIGTVLVVAALWCHAKSQPALDRAAAGITTISTNENGTHVQTNAITLGDEIAGPALERILSNLNYRKPLPSADGAVLKNLNIDRSITAIEAANLRISTANAEADDLHTSALECIVGAKSGAPVAQPHLEAPTELAT